MFPPDAGSAPLLLGFALGMRHALDADHVVAMSTIATRERSVARAALLGGWWGAGHSIALLGVGLLVILFRMPVSPAFGAWFERAVGVMLVALGLSSLWFRHRHDRSRTRERAREARPSPGERARPFGVGMVHGLAGSGPLAVAVLATMPSRAAGLVYLLLFGMGAIGGMAGVTAALALPARLGAFGSRGASWLTAAAGVGSVAFGLFYLTVSA